MDVSTSICDDPKFRRLARETPQLVAPAFTAYLATMAESWRVGRRVNVHDAWPAILPFDEAACDALVKVGLLDRRGVLAPKGWRSWFEPARERRQKSRDRWARYNAQRTGDTALEPRGNHADTATSVPPVPSVPSDPPGLTDSPNEKPLDTADEARGAKPWDKHLRPVEPTGKTA